MSWMRDYCDEHGVDMVEAWTCMVLMQRPARGFVPPLPPVYVSPLEIRSFRPEALEGIFGVGPGDMPALLARVAAIEEANRLWRSTAVPDMSHIKRERFEIQEPEL